jgi:hypothetical protein
MSSLNKCFSPSVSDHAFIMPWPIDGSGAHEGTKPQRMGLTTFLSPCRMITGTVWPERNFEMRAVFGDKTHRRLIVSYGGSLNVG